MNKKYGVWFIAALVAVVLFTGCHRQRTVDPSTLNVAVLNFDLARDVDTEQEIKGWWFSSRDVYYNPNAGILFGDTLADQLSKRCPYLDVYSRMDFKYYLVSKEEKLKRDFPGLSTAERKEILAELDPVDIGKDLGLDRVIVGSVNEAHTTHNRTFHWWSSVVAAETQILNVETGEAEWSGSVRERDVFLSWLGTAEHVAAQLVKRMKRHYFNVQ